MRRDRERTADRIGLAIEELSTLDARVKEKQARDEAIIKLLKKFDLDPLAIPVDFEELYLFAIIEYGVGRSNSILRLLQFNGTRETFRRAFEKGDLSRLVDQTNALVGSGKVAIVEQSDTEQIRKEFAIFCTVFSEIAKFGQNKEGEVHLHQKIVEIVNNLDKLGELEEIWARFSELAKGPSPTRFGLIPRPLRVFISSTMMEMRDVRESVAHALDEKHIDSWVFEADSGARPETTTESSLIEIENADVYVGLFWQKYGDVTVQEYFRARGLDKPCFVYIRDKDIQREAKLEDFLKDEVCEPHKGVTYNYFSSAIELGKQVAKDVMNWLVRRHREMTAEIQQAEVSQAEVNRLRSMVTRLQAASRERLPQGTATDYLAYQVRVWFETLAYRFEEYEDRTDEQFEWIINIPARRGFDRILVQGISGEVEAGDIALLEEAVHKHKTDEGWIIAARRISQAARNETRKSSAKLFCYTFDELLDECADFGGYLKWLDSEVKRRGIDKMYVPQNCIKEELDPLTRKRIDVSTYDESNGWIDGYIDRWLDDPSKEHVSILGEFGTGKTWFALHYAWVLAQSYLDAKKRGVERPRLPLVIPLRDYAKAVSVESLFSEFFFRKHEIPLPGYSAFEQLNKMGKLLLIFDGFDEMAAKVDRQKMINNFWDLARVVVPRSKVILTCRTEHFPEAKEGRALLSAELQSSTEKLTGEPPQFEVLELQKFNDHQIRQVLSFRTTRVTVTKIMDNPKLLDLARRPVMTEFILEALPDISAGKPVDLSRIYLYAAKRKMERDIKAERTFTSLADKIYFLCEVSWEMISSNAMSLNYRQFPETIRRLFSHATHADKDLDYWQHDMMTQTMLIRNADGDYTPAHRSLLEFFLAYKFAAELGILADDFTEPAREQSRIDKHCMPSEYTWSNYFQRKLDDNGLTKPIAPLGGFSCEEISLLERTFGRMPLTKTIVDLMRNMLVSSEAQIKNRLVALIKETRSNAMPRHDVGLVGGNSATLLIRIDQSALKEQDLEATNLECADFENAVLTGTNLQHANLQKTRFKGANLEKANMSGADLTLAEFTKLGGLLSIAYNPEGTMVATGSEDNNIYVFDMKTGEEFELKGHTGRVNDIAWRPDGLQLASASSDATIRLWDAKSGFQSTELKKHISEVTSICFSPDGNSLASGSIDGSVIVLDCRTLKTKTQRRFTGYVSSVRFSPDGKSIANRARRLAIAIWSADSGKTYKTIEDPQGGTSFRNLDFHPNGQYLALTTGYKSFRIMDADNLRVLRDIHCPGTHVTNLRFSPDGTQVAACCSKTVRIFSSFGGRRLATLEGHSEEVNSVSYHRSGQCLVSCSNDGSIIFWDSRPAITREESLEQHSFLETRGPSSEPATTIVAKITTEWEENEVIFPKGMVTNPRFGKCFHSIKRRFDCRGLRLYQARGLDVPGPDGNDTLGLFLERQGAILR